MKLNILLAALLVMALVVTGCEANPTTEKEKILNCRLKGTVIEGVETNSNYKVTYEGEYVQKIETEETITSNNVEYLETVKEVVESMYSPYKDVEYYDYKVQIDGNTLISTTNIDYSKIDIDELLKINSAMGALIEDDKLKVSDVEELYKQMGITCK